MTLAWSYPVWDPDRGLVSDRFDDTYFAGVPGGGVAAAAAHAVAETRQVYVEGNRLPERFSMSEYAHFTIGEVGFGTGLGLLCAASRFLQEAPETARLFFVSCEAFPIPRDRLRDALTPLLAAAPELRTLGGELLEVYRPWRPGLQVMRLAGGRVRLHLLVGDAATQLESYPFAASAWFLDGFAPKCNPECWSARLVTAITQRSEPTGASCATFTVAGSVRGQLEQAGWGVRRVDGVGRKKQVLTGRRGALSAGASLAGNAIQVFGAGMAGCAAARSFATRGWDVQVIDPNGVAAGASGHDAALYQPRLVRQADAGSRYHGEAFTYALWLYRHLPGFEDFEPCGVLHPAREPEEALRIQEQVGGTPVAPGIVEWLEPAAAEAIVGYPVPYGAAWIPSAGHVSPRALCHALLDHPRIEVLRESRADDGRPRILAMGSATKAAHGGSVDLPLIQFRGQLLRAKTSAGSDIGLSLDGYVGPRRNGIRVIGATYDKDQTSTRPSLEDDAVNWARLNMLPGLRESLGEIEEAGHWAGVRAATPDRLPMVGQAAQLELGDSRVELELGTCLTVGHGSRGCISAPLAGEILASGWCDEPTPVDRDIKAAIDPARFQERRLRRQRKR